MKLLIFVSDYILQGAASLLLFCELQLSFMSDFISEMQLFDGVIKIKFTLIIQLLHLFMLNNKCAMQEVYLIEFGLHFFELSFKLLYSFLAFFLDFPETNDFPLGFLCLQLYLVHLRNQSATLFLIHLLELFGFLKLQLQVLFFVL